MLDMSSAPPGSVVKLSDESYTWMILSVRYDRSAVFITNRGRIFWDAFCSGDTSVVSTRRREKER